MRLLLLLLLFFPIAESMAQSPLDSVVIQTFGDVAPDAPGYVVGVFRPSEPGYIKGFGQANLEHGVAIQPATAFNIASLSKQFTAAAIALLIKEGKVDLTDPVAPYFKKWPFKKDMQVKHLIYMTSGINDYYYNDRSEGLDWSSLHFFNVEDAMAASFSVPLMYTPGTSWSYSNINYMLLTRIVEAESGKSFAEFCREKLFVPLGMLNTRVDDDIFTVIPNRALGYNHRDAENTDWLVDDGYLPKRGDGWLQIHRNAAHYGGSGMFTTMEDFGKWLGEMHAHAVFGEEFWQLMFRTEYFEHDKENDAFGLVHGNFNGRPVITYDGGDWGFSSCFLYFPEQALAVACFSNVGSGNARQRLNRLLDGLSDNSMLPE